MKNKKYLFVSLFLILITLFLIFKFNINALSSDFDLKISVEKESYLLGEDVFVKFTIINEGKYLDSVSNFSDGTLSSYAEINSDKMASLPFFERPPLPLTGYYQKIKPGEKIEIIAMINAFRGSEGAPTLTYFSVGDYSLRGVYKDNLNRIVKSNKIEFKIKEPEGNELKAFEDFKYFVNFYNEHEKKRITQEDNILFINKAVDFLYKYPTSIYSGKILNRSYSSRYYGNYKCDDSFLKDVEFYISNNPNSNDIKYLIGNIASLFHNKLGGKEKAKEYLNRLKGKFNSSKLDGQITRMLSEDELLK